MAYQSFSINADAALRRFKNIVGRYQQASRDFTLRAVGDMTTRVYNYATKPRPKIGRRKDAVSDPAARYGVPVKTGTLQKSIQQRVSTPISGSIIGRIWTHLFYAKYMEFGTSRIRPRPFMTPALELNREWFKKHVAALWNSTMRRLGTK